MKKFLVNVAALFCMTTSLAFAENLSARALLLHMHQESRDLSYEMSYILIKKDGIEPLLYRHALYANKELAHLVYLSGPMREVIRRGDEVSYIEPGTEPFTIGSKTMVAPVMPLIHSDINRLGLYYDFIKIGRAREAGVACHVIRIVPKDGLRYSYVLWVDEQTSLPLRADLVDRNGEVIEQYRVLSYSVTPEITKLMAQLDHVRLPDRLSFPETHKTQRGLWYVSWVPKGFTSQALNRYRIAISERLVESRIFSDGLFDFSVYVSERGNQDLKDQLLRQGRRTLHSIIKGNTEISVIGDIPPDTAKRIAQSVQFGSPQQTSQ